MMEILIILTLLMGSLFGATFNVSTTPEFRQALLDAAQNGQDDTIILADGTYKTTDDGQGTFIFLDNEEYALTLKGSGMDKVILSGDNVHKTLDIRSSSFSAELFLEYISIKYSIEAGLNTNLCDVNISNVKISNNKGVGFSSNCSGGTNIENSIISYNSEGGIGERINTIRNSTVTYNRGTNYGGLYSVDTLINSTVSNNSATNGTGGIGQANNIINSTVSYNSGNRAACEGSCSYMFSASGGVSRANYIENSIISFNSSSGDMFASAGVDSSATIINSKITNNHCTNTSYQGCAVGFSNNITNSIIANNTSGIGSSSRITNSIFINNTKDIFSSSSQIITLQNNYIDENNIDNDYVLSLNNIYDGINLGFVDQANGNYHLTAPSDLIDAGTTDVDGVTLPATDLDGNARIVGSSIDIGPYEFSTTRPTITSFTYTGEAKEMSELVFDVQYSFSSGRSLGTVEFDFTGDGTYESRYAHTYTQAGTYTASVKITGNTGEFSIKSLEIIVAKISLEDKLLTVLIPSEVDTLMPWINEEVDTQVTDKIDTCKANPKSCGIKSGVVVIPF